MNALSARLILMLLVTSLLAGCGFHLRTSDALAQHAPIYVKGLNRHDPFYRTLNNTMTASGIQLVETGKQSRSVLKIRDHGESQQVITVDSRGKATEYVLIRKVTISLNRHGGGELVPEQTVGVRRNWIEAGKTGLAGYREAAELREEMLQELSQSILRVLDYSLR